MASANNNENTDLDALNDAVGVAGVDLTAEEERMRAASKQQAQQTQHRVDRRRTQNFIEQEVLERTMTTIASMYRLKNIEPDALPLIALAAQERLRGLIDLSVKSRNHRLEANAKRPPPIYPVTEDDEKIRKQKEKGEGYDGIWDQAIISDPETVLRTVFRIERNEEMKERRARTARDEAERTPHQDGATPGSGGDGSAGAGGTGASGSGTGGGDGADETGTGNKRDRKGDDGKREKKRKKESKTALSEDQAKKFSDATAKAMTGGPKYSWMLTGSAGGAWKPPTPAGGSGSGANDESGANLPKPKFTPVSKQDDVGSLLQTGGGNLTGFTHEDEPKKLTMRDVVFAFEHESGGGGAGRGTGSRSLYLKM